MTSNPVDRESRRSTQVRLKVRIEVLGGSEPLTCEGETFVVNLHGALILTAVALRVGMKIGIYVLLTDKRAIADVVYVDPEQPRHSGINLEKPGNIWGMSLQPEDWDALNSQ
jgi:hypothetical protein